MTLLGAGVFPGAFDEALHVFVLFPCRFQAFLGGVDISLVEAVQDLAPGKTATEADFIILIKKRLRFFVQPFDEVAHQ